MAAAGLRPHRHRAGGGGVGACSRGPGGCHWASAFYGYQLNKRWISVKLGGLPAAGICHGTHPPPPVNSRTAQALQPSGTFGGTGLGWGAAAGREPRRNGSGRVRVGRPGRRAHGPARHGHRARHRALRARHPGARRVDVPVVGDPRGPLDRAAPDQPRLRLRHRPRGPAEGRRAAPGRPAPRARGGRAGHRDHRRREAGGLVRRGRDLADGRAHRRARPARLARRARRTRRARRSG